MTKGLYVPKDNSKAMALIAMKTKALMRHIANLSIKLKKSMRSMEVEKEVKLRGLLRNFTTKYITKEPIHKRPAISLDQTMNPSDPLVTIIQK